MSAHESAKTVHSSHIKAYLLASGYVRIVTYCLYYICITTYSVTGTRMITHKADKLAEFFQKYPKRSYPKGQILFLSGDHSDYAYYMASGSVKVYTHSYKGDEVVLLTVTPKRMFPTSAIINDSVIVYNYQAITPIELHVAPKEDIIAFITSEPELEFMLLGQAHLALERVVRKMHLLMAGNANDLVVFELLECFYASGIKNDSGDYVVHLSEQELGARAGLTRETVSREVNRLREHGLVSSTRGKIVLTKVLDLEARVANF